VQADRIVAVKQKKKVNDLMKTEDAIERLKLKLKKLDEI
jgi:hypothetical protein